MGRPAIEYPPEIVRSTRERYPNGKRCPECGEVLPADRFHIRRRKEGYRLSPYCIDCGKKILLALAQKRKYRPKPKGEKPVITGERIPIPTLEVGRVYEVIDTGFTGGQYEGRPTAVTYRGPCVGRWGRNWGIATATGIRTFSPGQLVGLQIREVRAC